jgi:hypothetical protein
MEPILLLAALPLLLISLRLLVSMARSRRRLRSARLFGRAGVGTVAKLAPGVVQVDAGG